MDLKILTIVLIYFISESQGDIFLSVPFNEHFNRRSGTYEYRGKFFKNLKYLIRKISLDFPEVPYQNILLKREFKTSENIVNDIHTNNRYLQVQINGVSRYITLPSYHIVIEFVMHHGKKYFICNRSPFKTYKEAKIYCEHLEEFSQFKLQHIFLGKNLLASKIWRNTWKDCYYKCYSQNHFLELKKKIIRELCMLRNIDHESPIRYNKTLEFTANYHARINALVNKLLVAGDEKSKVHEVAAFINPPLASLQVNKWYNSYVEEQTDINRKSKKESKQFHLLLSPHIKEVGVGVTLYRRKLSIVLTFA